MCGQEWGYMLVLNVSDDVLSRIAGEERIEHDGKEVTVYRIPALEIGKPGPSVRKEFLSLMGLREHQQEMKAAQEAKYHSPPEGRESLARKLFRLFPR